MLLGNSTEADKLSGMEFGDLTVELSDLSQDIKLGVRTSTRAVRIAEESLENNQHDSTRISMSSFRRKYGVKSSVHGQHISKDSCLNVTGIGMLSIASLLMLGTYYYHSPLSFYLTHKNEPWQVTEDAKERSYA
ncbi:hypothetical protein SAY87_008466 [Trapa incisa]|uniref:Uncharacterized protein n=1 Tax=Trapa incisa TaxID=236973 RepID=A0AAN7KG48_9MYRT|nr:hypothetical protein SAY87_008466 [Trapa incisa]